MTVVAARESELPPAAAADWSSPAVQRAAPHPAHRLRDQVPVQAPASLPVRRVQERPCRDPDQRRRVLQQDPVLPPAVAVASVACRDVGRATACRAAHSWAASVQPEASPVKAAFRARVRRFRRAASARRAAGVPPGEHRAAERRHLAVSGAAARGHLEESAPASAAETAPRTAVACAQAVARSPPLEAKVAVSRVTAAFPAAGSVPNSTEAAGRAWPRVAWAALDAREQPPAEAQAESPGVPAHAAKPGEVREAAGCAPAEPRPAARDATAEAQAARPVRAAAPQDRKSVV